MYPLPDAPCFQTLSGILMGVFLVKVTLSPLNQKIENQGQPFQNQHQFHRMTTYVFGKHCFLHICRTVKVKLINNRKSACRWFFIFAFSKTTAGSVANNWVLIELWDPVLFSSLGTAVPMHRHSCSWSLQVYCLGSNSLSGKLFRNWLLKALAYFQLSSRIHHFEANRPQSEQNISFCVLNNTRAMRESLSQFSPNSNASGVDPYPPSRPRHTLSAPVSFCSALSLGSGSRNSSRCFCKDGWSALSKEFALTFLLSG